MIKPGAAVIDVGINRVDGALVGDVAHDVLTPSQRQELAQYLERKRTVKIGQKYRWLRWSAAHSPLMCRLYDYGSFVWRRYKARKDKLQE